jgi:lipopolysaccharide biosynthesis glycosyltransferase
MIRVFIGYDARETVAFHVLAHSILRHASKPVSVSGLVLSQLPMWRDRHPAQSTDFAFSRFLVPHLCGFRGRAIFMDCDMLCRADILELWEALSTHETLGVVKHEYQPATESKFLQQQQTRYARKNWSSVMVFNCERCTKLTPDYVNSASGMELHQFKWLEDDEIEFLPREWNHLVGEYEPNPDAKLAHFTLGTPCFAPYSHCEFAPEWRAERDLMLSYDAR